MSPPRLRTCLPAALLALAVAACGGGATDPVDALTADARSIDAEPIDARPIDAQPVDAEWVEPDANPPTVDCNPVTQTGCDASEKCTWVTVVDATQTEPGIGITRCVPDGTAAVGEACTEGPAGETTGYDTCAAGGYCIRAVCEQICTDVPDSCNTAVSACSRYSGLFTDSSPVIGVCDFKCDPVDQTRLYDSAAACGSPAGTDPTRACYGYVDVDFTCAPVISLTNTHYANLGGAATLNACAPGYGLLPLGLPPPDENAFLCAAYCRPQPTHSAAPTDANGGGGFACADRGAAAPANECRYWTWFDVVFGASGAPDPDNADHGICVRYADHVYDDDGDVGTPNVAFPSCTSLSLADGPDADSFPDAEAWGCVPQVTAPAVGGSFRTAMRKKLGVIGPPAAPAPRR